jgi:hypothetical protein
MTNEDFGLSNLPLVWRNRLILFEGIQTNKQTNKQTNNINQSKLSLCVLQNHSVKLDAVRTLARVGTIVYFENGFTPFDIISLPNLFRSIRS